MRTQPTHDIDPRALALARCYEILLKHYDNWLLESGEADMATANSDEAVTANGHTEEAKPKREVVSPPLAGPLSARKAKATHNS